jgi:competence protein ComEC
MSPALVLPLALAALMLPPGAGLLVAATAAIGTRAWRRDGQRLMTAGLALLALAPLAPLAQQALGQALRPGDDVPREGAVRLAGRWRQPPCQPAFLHTAAGDLPVRFAEGLQPPAPGTPVEILARVGPSGPPLAISVAARGPPAGAWLDRWAAEAGARVGHLVSRDNEGLVAALILGQREHLAFPVAADCVATGTSHLLAVSGLNVVLLAVALQRCGAGHRPGLLMLVLVLFTLVAGAGAPLRRASVGFVLLFAGLRHARLATAIHRLLAVALLLEAWQPGLHRDLSAQLSFLAVAGLILGARLVRGPAAALIGPCGAFLATAPICAETFGRVAPFGVLATPLIVPFVGLILCVGLVAVLPGALLGALDPLSGPLLDGAASLMRWTLRQLAEWGPAPLRPPPPPLPGWILSLLVIGSLAVLARRRRSDGAWAERVA